MNYVMGIDLGTSAVKVSVIDHVGKLVEQTSVPYPLIQSQPGYSEQDPEEWVTATTKAIRQLVTLQRIQLNQIEGLSYSGQMHGLVLLGQNNQVLRPAILWNDTRTTKQCTMIRNKMGATFTKITCNQPLEGFTLPKLLWIKENEPDIFKQIKLFLLPKDYLRYRMTGELATDYSDAAGTVLLDVLKKSWSTTICRNFDIPLSICPTLIEANDCVGNINADYASASGLAVTTKVFAGAADNAAGAIGAGILKNNQMMSSIGTSGVVLKYESKDRYNPHGKLHFFNHALHDQYYAMGVSLAAGYSLNWFKKTFGKQTSFPDLILQATHSPLGANGLLFTPYIMGERTPYTDAMIRGSFIGISSHTIYSDFVRAVLEGITFSFKDMMQLFGDDFQYVDTIVSIGGGAKSPFWLQMQADIFNKKVISLKNEQGPGFGAAMLAAVGLGWFKDLKTCADEFIDYDQVYQPEKVKVAKYYELYQIYKRIYQQTRLLSKDLASFRNR